MGMRGWGVGIGQWVGGQVKDVVTTAVKLPAPQFSCAPARENC